LRVRLPNTTALCTWSGRSLRTAPLEKRIAQLEARPVVKDAGVWRTGTLYRAGEIVSHGGSGWICSETHSAGGPEPNHKFFRLFVTASRDARR
jgi:hypothetical protein